MSKLATMLAMVQQFGRRKAEPVVVNEHTIYHAPSHASEMKTRRKNAKHARDEARTRIGRVLTKAVLEGRDITDELRQLGVYDIHTSVPRWAKRLELRLMKRAGNHNKPAHARKRGAR